MTVAPTLDFWFDFASTYSYPACMRAEALAKDGGVTIRYRPFLVGPIFKAQGWDTSPFNVYETKGRYMWRDLTRLCADLSIPFQKPSPFPQNSLLAARVAMAGEGEAWRGRFCCAVFHAQFGEGRRIDDPAVIGDLLQDIGAPARSVLQLAQSDPVKLQLRTQTEEAGRLGIFGAPSFLTADGELFWGNDRLEAAIAWAKRAAGT
jgi:2-hydroxychromene-2-carboxylate isomerase